MNSNLETSRTTTHEIEERFKLIAKATHDTIWDWNLRSNEVWWNENFVHMFGYSLDEIEPDSASWSNRIHPDDLDRVLRTIHDVIDGGGENWKDEYRFRRSDGSYAHVFDRGYVLRDENGPYRMVGSMLDITERINVTEKLRDSEERLRMTIESTKLGTFDFNLVTGELNWDDRCKELFGLPPGAFVDYSVFLKGLHPDDLDRVDGIVQNVLLPESGGNYDIEYRTIGIEDGKLRWLAARGKALFDGGDRAYRFLGTVLDITDRRVMEEELKSSDERLREALLVASTGTWKIDLATNVDTRDASLNKILGLEAKEDQIPLPDSFARIHPDDKERVKNSLEAAIQRGGVYDEECRIFQPDGTMRWLKDRGQVVRDENGKPKYVIGAAIDITDQKIKEEKIKISEERFRGLFNNASVGIALINLNGGFIELNPVICGMFGYDEEAFMTLDIHSISSPHFVADIVNNFQQLILGQQNSFVKEQKFIRNNGQEFWGEISVSIVKDLHDKPQHLIAIVHDIDEKRKAEDWLKLQARVLESMDEGVSVADEEGYIVYTNASEDKMFGYGPGELTGQNVTIQNAYPTAENQARVNAVLAELKSHGYWNGEWLNKRKDGSVFYTYSHITALQLGYRKVMVCVQRDITEEKRYKEFLQRNAEELEAMVNERTRELKEANQLLAKSNEELEQFAYITSHDLQEPLRKIKTFASLLLEEAAENGNPQVNRYLQKISASSERMTVLIKDLLNYSRLSKEHKQFSKVNLNKILEDVLSDFEVMISQKNAVVFSEPLPEVHGIGLQLNQLFFNLIGNSLKFSKPNLPPAIRISCRTISTGEAAKLGLDKAMYYEIIFSDNGIGFNPKYKDQIFDIFQRLHSSEQFSGTGIGLALSKKVVENHHGSIMAESIENEGASFKIYLPLTV